jgi:hypothetical protein
MFNLHDTTGHGLTIVGCTGEHPDRCTARLIDVDGRPASTSVVPYRWKLHMVPQPRPVATYFDLS